VRAVLPQMLERGRGKILVMGSAAALRGARLAYVRAVGVELAPKACRSMPLAGWCAR